MGYSRRAYLAHEHLRISERQAWVGSIGFSRTYLVPGLDKGLRVRRRNRAAAGNEHLRDTMSALLEAAIRGELRRVHPSQSL